MIKYFFLFSFVLLLNEAKSQDLLIEIDHIKSVKGEVLIAIFNTEEGFPFLTSKAIQLLKAIPSQGKAQCIVKALPVGRYAIALFHDSNADGKLNTNLIGIPKEGYGVSNNAYNTFSAPRYKDALFEFKANSTQQINMKY
jgi:hypothetical protein